MRKNMGQTDVFESTAEEIDLRSILFKYLKHWKYFVLSIVLCFCVMFLIYLTLDRKYEMSSSVLLKEDKGTAQGNSPLGSLQELGLLSTTNNVDNEIAVFSSPNLMRQVVEKLEINTTYKKKGLLRDTEMYKKSVYYVSLPDIDLYTLASTVELNLKSTDEGVEISGEYKVNDEKIKINGQIDVLPGYLDLPSHLGRLFVTYRPDVEDEQKGDAYKIMISNPQRIAYDLAHEISISPTTKQSSVLQMKLSVLNRSKGMDILTELVHLYNKNNVEDNNEMASNTSRFIDARLLDISQELEDVETDVEEFKKAQKITDIGSEARVFVEETAEIEKRRTEIETQLKTIDLVEQFVSSPDNSYKIIPTLGILDQGLIAIISEYNTVLLNYDRLVRATTEDNPTRLNIKTQLENTRLGIKQSIGNVRRTITLSKKEVDLRIAAIASKIVSVPTQERGLLEIMRQQSVKQSLYLYLMKMKEETNITMASTSDKAKVITDPIIPQKPVSPKLMLFLLLAGIIGVAIPVAIIYIQEALRLNISNREELETLSTVSVIGEIMKKKEEDPTIIVRKNVTSPLIELFRALRNNIQFILSGKKVLLVTSTIPGEGKTFVSINLAASYALSDKKVLIVGLDVRNPKLASDMGFVKGLGITSLLSGAEKDWKSLLTHIPEHPNLDILQAGIIPPNPNELLMKPELKTLIKEMRECYDVIILDSAPIGVISDSLLLGEVADLTVYVTRENVTPKNAIEFVNEVYESKKLPSMYMVLNGVELTKNKGRHGRYGYGYSYGYGENKH